jgi:phosphatidylglycerophosphatase A
MQRLALFLATFAYCGYAPIAPGTAGSAAGLVVYAAMRAMGWPVAGDLAVAGILLVAGVWAASSAERQLGLDDPGPVVIDEVVGMLVTLLFTGAGWTAAFAGFVYFRVFDIVKPYPAGRLERLGGGLGIMADDLMAGIYANVALQLTLRLLPGWIG